MDFSSLPRQPQPAISTESITADQLSQSRQQLSSDGASSPALAKDNTVNPRAMLMGYDPKDPLSASFIAQMAEVGKVEDFRVLASAEPEQLRKGQRKLSSSATENTSWVVSAGGHDSWVEDHGEVCENGQLVIPKMLPADSDDIEDWVFRGRRQRYNEMAEAGQPRLRPDYSYQGLVNRRQAQEEMLSTALATKAGATQALSYVEGGNMLPGHRSDGTPFALVGADSLAVTQKLCGGDAVATVARDYGYQPDQVIAVEQPGDFHIDMGMALGGPGQVLLNDARQVLQLQKGWLSEHYAHKWLGREELPEQMKKLETAANRRALYEDLIASQLKEAGLQVFRVAGCFPETAANPPMNFLNLRQGRNDRGESFAVALGGQPQAEEAFAHSLLGEYPCGYQRIHFLDRKLTTESLKYNGGIKCRSKALP